MREYANDYSATKILQPNNKNSDKKILSSSRSSHPRQRTLAEYLRPSHNDDPNLSLSWLTALRREIVGRKSDGGDFGETGEEAGSDSLFFL